MILLAYIVVFVLAVVGSLGVAWLVEKAYQRGRR